MARLINSFEIFLLRLLISTCFFLESEPDSLSEQDPQLLFFGLKFTIPISTYFMSFFILSCMDLFPSFFLRTSSNKDLFFPILLDLFRFFFLVTCYSIISATSDFTFGSTLLALFSGIVCSVYTS